MGLCFVGAAQLEQGRGLKRHGKGWKTGWWVMSERFQKEIEEILQHSGELPEKEAPRRQEGKRRIFPVSFKGFSKGLSPGKVLLVSVALLLTALLVRGAAPAFMGLLLWVSLVLFITAYALFFVRWEDRVERRWRGMVVDYSTAPSWWQRLRRKLRF